MVLAVALDSVGAEAAKAFTEVPNAADVPPPVRRLMGWDDALWEAAGRPSYPCLLDTEHRVAKLFNLTNVPSALWIDEQGRVVRPAEHAGAYDMLREINLETFEVPDEAAKAGRENRAHYVDALRDWVEKGEKSAYVLSADEVARRSPGPSEQDSLAHAHFQIGALYTAAGERERAKPFFAEAVRLRPESWTIRRQEIASADADAVGELAATPDFWEAVNNLGERNYYEPFRG